MEPIWSKLNVSETSDQFLYRFIILTDGFKLIVTDLIRLYCEEIVGEDSILAKCQQFNPALEVSECTDLLFELSKIFQSKDSAIKATVSRISDTCKLSVTGNLFNSRFFWEFNLNRSSAEEFYQEITLPNLASVTYLHSRQKKLVTLVKAKDEEIQDFQASGGVLTRKSLKTKIFTEDQLVSTRSQDLFTFLTSEDFSDLCVASTSDLGSESDTVTQQPTRPTQSPVKTQNPNKDPAGKRRLNSALNPIASSKQLKTGGTQTLTQTQTQKQHGNSNIKSRLKKL